MKFTVYEIYITFVSYFREPLLSSKPKILSICPTDSQYLGCCTPFVVFVNVLLSFCCLLDFNCRLNYFQTLSHNPNCAVTSQLSNFICDLPPSDRSKPCGARASQNPTSTQKLFARSTSETMKDDLFQSIQLRLRKNCKIEYNMKAFFDLKAKM